MRLHHWATSLLATAAIPYLLVSGARQAGLVTHLKGNGSGERLVYARCPSGRQPEISKQLRNVLPGFVLQETVEEASGELVLIWRDGAFADLEKAGNIEVENIGIWQEPLSLFSKHKWQEVIEFDRAGATDVEVEGAELAQLRYLVRMPGSIVRTNPPAKTDGNRAQWTVRVKDEPQTFIAESRSLRWPYLLLLIFVGLFVVVKGSGLARRIVKKIPRRPRRI